MERFLCFFLPLPAPRGSDVSGGFYYVLVSLLGGYDVGSDHVAFLVMYTLPIINL